MSKENDKIFRTLEHIAITFDKLGYSPTIPIFKGHQDFEWLFKLELDTIKMLCNQQDQKITDLEAKLAESENKLNQYPYKNDVIEKQYEDLKDGIKFRVENNITDDWEQLYHCIDVLCEKHKARIRDIENGIRKIEEFEKLLNAKEKMKTQSLKGFEKLKQQLAEKEKENQQLRDKLHTSEQETIHFHNKYFAEKQIAIEQLEKVKEFCENWKYYTENINYVIVEEKNGIRCNPTLYETIDNQIKAIKEME